MAPRDDRTDPFAVLGLSRGATGDEIRRARRRLAAAEHPDAGGDTERMSRINAAATEALAIAERSTPRTPPGSGGADDDSAPHHEADRPRREPPGETDGRRIDHPSFVVEALPAVTFEALSLAAAELGEVADDDPPYRMWVLLEDPPCWCRLDVVPDAGSSTVGLAIAPADALDHNGRAPLPAVEHIRDQWVGALNALDWSAL